ncbi:MAG: VCBS repeat-containing protein [Cyclobacteriaceae bacterium]|nr:VCBS repeat-containing protein [Cyclobacteriaceae bacterium]
MIKIRTRFVIIPSFALMLVVGSCRNTPNALYEKLTPEQTGIYFANNLSYSDTLSILDFEYLFNGGGVAIGDINNDGLQDIYFTGNMTSGKLYLNLGNLKFEDITEKAGMSTSVWCNGVTMVDINQDGYKDIFISVAGTRNTADNEKNNLLFVNTGNNTFLESAKAYGLQGTGHNIQTTFFDYDKDGDLDVYFLRNAFVEYSRNRARPKSVKGESSTTDQLYRNNGDNTFTDVSEQAGILIEGFGLGVQSCDINDDGWPDIYVSNDFITNDLLYINNQNGTFTNLAGKYFKHATYNAMGNDIADINNDGFVDLVEVDMLPADNYRWKVTIMGNTFDEFENGLRFGYEPQYIRNTLQLNNGNGTFSEIGYLAGIEATDWSWSPLIADYDNDGLKDLFITNGYRQDITNLDFIKFSERTLRMGTAEANKKERLEMLASIPGIQVPKYLFQNNGNLTFTDRSEAWGLSSLAYSNGAAYADLDNDGDLDLVTNNLDEAASIFKNSINNTSTDSLNFLRIGFEGPLFNREGFGTKVYVWNKGTLQYLYFTPFRGFLSSVEPFLHFGLRQISKLDSVKVIWPDGNLQVLMNVKSNQTLTLKYSEANPQQPKAKIKIPTLFEEATEIMGLSYVHSENDFVDFKVQPLLPHMHSRNGPGIAISDINNDGLDDFFIGGALGDQGTLFVQQRNGKFINSSLTKNNNLADQMGVLFFDADNDGDKDLYVVSGGTEEKKESMAYGDHLYINDGRGKFSEAVNSLPAIYQSGSCVIATDYDHDGDLDLFVGGRIIPGEYPMPANSHLLRNDSGNGKVLFTDITKICCPDLLNFGLVTAGLWTDVNNDGWKDLLLVGEFMPITYFKNNEGKSFEKIASPSLAHTHGWWNSLTAGDFDHDGDMDYIAGNLGLNSRYKGSTKEPLCIYANDYDKNGSIDPVMSLYINGEKQIAHTWDDLVKQIPPIRARFRTYEPYAKANFEKSFLPEEISNAYKVCSEWFETSYIENEGNGNFSVTPLPIQIQISPVHGVVVEDYDRDGNLDALLIGNSYSTEVSTGRYDASIGYYLKGNGKGGFSVVASVNSGFMVDQDSKSLAKLVAADGRELILAGINNGMLKVHRSNSMGNYFIPSSDAEYADVKLKGGGSYRHEFYYGSSYLSNSSRKFRWMDDMTELTIHHTAGKKTTVKP